MNYLDISGLSLAHNKVIFHHLISSSICLMKIFLNVSFYSCSVHQYWREATLPTATSSIQVVLINNHNWSFSFWDWLLSSWILFVCFGKNIWFSKYEAVSDQGPVWVRSEDKIPSGFESTPNIIFSMPRYSLVTQLSEKVWHVYSQN